MLEIKPSHKPIKNYYIALDGYVQIGVTKETSVRGAFADLLNFYAKKLKWLFTEEYTIPLKSGHPGSVDGAIVDKYNIVMGYWEAKDSKDDLKKEIKAKFDKGYPKNNILFQEPNLAVLYQDGVLIDDYDLTKPERLVACLEDFFGYKADEQANWEELVSQFKDRIPESAVKLVSMIEQEKKTNPKFKEAFKNFADLCRASINPNLADPAIEEMLVQHLLTSRIFSTVFNNPEFVRRNVIAAEIEKVIDALTSRSFNRTEFFAPLDHFYTALERRAQSITEWSQKQAFLNTVYEKFFQGFAVKVADTHGIVYTPQPIVDFMVRSVEHILKTEFGRSLGSEGVHILDPFVGTGNFIMRIMREIQKTKLPQKYASELHCNEVMLLPYYIASMNIEHEYFAQTGDYKPFEGICMVDTFELAEPSQHSLFSTENTERVERQKKSPIFVIIGNPPYNAGQVNENDNNKNRKYPVIDKRVNETYARDSMATLVNQLSDPYVKAFRYASDRVGEEGIVAFVSNNSYLEAIAFDGMRKNLFKDFTTLYIVDLKGNIRRDSMKDGIGLGEKHTVFGLSAMVGISIAFFVKKRKQDEHKIFYSEVNFRSTRKEKFEYLNKGFDIYGVSSKLLEPDKNSNWLNEGITTDFEEFYPLGSKELKRSKDARSLFANYSNGVKTNSDAYTYNFNKTEQQSRAQKMVLNYDSELDKWKRGGQSKNIEASLEIDESTLKWIRNTKRTLLRGIDLKFDESKLRDALYRPFCKQTYYFERAFNEDTYSFPKILPSNESEKENYIICVTAVGNTKPFQCLVSNHIVDLHLTGDSQCFPFYTYDEDGTNRRENITDWALEQFKIKNAKLKIKKETTKWDIFYYVYGILHHPEYRKKYAANLRRELPRVPVSPDFWAISEAGKKLADLHVNYESQKEYDLEEVWKPGSTLDLRVEKMKLKKSIVDSRSSEAEKKDLAIDNRPSTIDLIYNDKLTLRGIPPEVFEYKLGNRSALDWVIDQYQVSTDKRSGITNDPNRDDEPDYIIKLIRKVITVSLETVKVVSEIEGMRME